MKSKDGSGTCVYLVSFKGIPEVAFYNLDALAVYLKKERTSLEKVRQDTENNPMPKWEVHTVEVR